MAFADDIRIMTRSVNAMQALVRTVHNFSEEHGLRINLSAGKTEVMVVQAWRKSKTTHKLKPPDIRIGGEQVRVVQGSYVYLGVRSAPTGRVRAARDCVTKEVVKRYGEARARMCFSGIRRITVHLGRTLWLPCVL